MRIYWYKALAALALAVVMLACSSFHPTLPKPLSPTGDTAHGPSTPASRGYPILGAAAAVCTVLAVGSVLLHAWLPILPPKLTVAAFGCAVGLWVLQELLIKDMWIIRVAIGLTTAVYAAQWLYAHRNWKAMKEAIS